MASGAGKPAARWRGWSLWPISSFQAVESDEEVFGAAQGGVVAVGRRVGDSPGDGEAAGERAQRDVRFDPGEGRAAAERSASGKRAGSQLPEASSSTTVAPLGMVTPATSTSARVVRVRNCTGGS